MRVGEKSKTCPYCGEEILAIAAKCKHCGEWLDAAAKPDTPESRHTVQLQDNSKLRLFQYFVVGENDRPLGQSFVCARDTHHAEELIATELEPGTSINKNLGVTAEDNRGKFSCPRCGFKFTKCSRDAPQALRAEGRRPPLLCAYRPWHPPGDSGATLPG